MWIMIASTNLSPKKEIVDLSIAIAVMNAWNRISVGFRKLSD
jgi:hypothetical protein